MDKSFIVITSYSIHYTKLYENPRVALEKVLFDIGKAKYFGQDTQGFCVELQRTKELFATFKPETTLHPDWGREKLAEALAKCSYNFV